ncbi:hypothetical protein DFS34DRAFT_589704 [Phlyctochytrium arcticum]|nr:hypothetical protein DFS34DRAFT_589704 [Phlyctochytrium arcticum]
MTIDSLNTVVRASTTSSTITYYPSNPRGIRRPPRPTNQNRHFKVSAPAAPQPKRPPHNGLCSDLTQSLPSSGSVRQPPCPTNQNSHYTVAALAAPQLQWPPHNSFGMELAKRMKAELTKIQQDWETSEMAGVWKKFFAACLTENELVSSDDEFEIYTRPDSPPAHPDQLSETAIATALAAAAPSLLSRQSKTSCITGITLRCFQMFFSGNLKDVLAQDGTQEWEYRSGFLDRLFERTLTASWLEWTSGELPNEVVSRERSSTVSSPKHDGVGAIVLDLTTTLSTIFLEVVGGVANADKAKHRKDTKKVFKAMSAAVQVQHLMVLNRGYPEAKAASALQRIGAFGIVVAGRSLCIYGGKWVDDLVAIDLLAKCSVPSRKEDWADLGELVRQCIYLRERVGFLAQVLKAVRRDNPDIPSPAIVMTPATKRSKRK